jgi:hypothetical protein
LILDVYRATGWSVGSGLCRAERRAEAGGGASCPGLSSRPPVCGFGSGAVALETVSWHDFESCGALKVEIGHRDTARLDIVTTAARQTAGRLDNGVALTCPHLAAPFLIVARPTAQE